MLFYNHFLVHELLDVCCGREKKLNPWMQLEILSVFRTFLQATNFKNFIRTSLAYVMHMLCFRKKHMRKLNIWHNLWCLFSSAKRLTSWKVSKNGVFSGPYFPAFGLDTERYFASVFRPNAGKYGPEKTQYLNTFTLWLRISLQLNAIYWR